MKFLEKLKSRKFLAALAGAAVGVAILLGADGTDIKAIAGAVVSVSSLVTYILVEGKVDAAALGKTVKDITDAVRETADDD